MQVVTPRLQTVVLFVNWDLFGQGTTFMSTDLGPQQCCKSRYAHEWLKLVEFGSSTQNKVVSYKHGLVKYNLQLF